MLISKRLTVPFKCLIISGTLAYLQVLRRAKTKANIFNFGNKQGLCFDGADTEFIYVKYTAGTIIHCPGREN